MNEGDEATVSTVARKKRRRSGFRYSSKKVLERSRVKRETCKKGGTELESVTRALSFPCETSDIFHHDCAPGSSLHTILDRVVEVDGDGIDLSLGFAYTPEGCNPQVSILTIIVVVRTLAWIFAVR